MEIVLSTLPKTWIIDLDGTLLKHNGYKTDGKDTLLAGVAEFMSKIPSEDRVLILTSRKEEAREQTIRFLAEHGIQYHAILFNMPLGERIVINDRKPSGLDMAVAVNLDRDCFQPPVLRRER